MLQGCADDGIFDVIIFATLKDASKIGDYKNIAKFLPMERFSPCAGSTQATPCERSRLTFYFVL